MGNTSVPHLVRLRRLLERYRPQALIAVAVSATIALLLAQIVSSFDEFLTDNEIIPYLTLLIVLDLAVAQQAAREPETLDLADNQDESMPVLLTAVSSCRRTGADLLEYAAATTLPLIRALRREEVPVRILIKHPETVDGVQRQRSIITLETLYNSIYAEYDGEFEIRCYRQGYSLRARRLGNVLLELGWLTPNVERQTAYGHHNPSIMVDLTKAHGDSLRSFFDRTFSDLWSADETEDGRRVLERMQSDGSAQVP